MEFLFWLLIALIIYIYLGYPGTIWLKGKLFPKVVKKNDIEPSISIITSAYNEFEGIEKFIQNKLELDYPDSKWELIIVSDCSNDGTDEIIKKYAEKYSDRIRYIRQNSRQGKTAALKTATDYSRGDILVFADANSIYEKKALRKLVRNFSDETIGYVTGKMVYVNEQGDLIGDGCSSYMRYENWLRFRETISGSIIGVDGGIDAMRKNLFKKIDADLLPDLVIPLNVVEMGYRVIYEEEALLKEESLNNPADEFRMRVRVALRAFHGLWYKKNLFNCFKFGVFSFQLFFHKLLRYIVGTIQILILFINILLLPTGIAYHFILFVQAVFYILFIIGHLLIKGRVRIPKVITLIYYFNLLNIASIYALMKFFMGKKQIVWTPRTGQ